MSKYFEEGEPVIDDRMGAERCFRCKVYPRLKEVIEYDINSGAQYKCALMCPQCGISFFNPDEASLIDGISYGPMGTEYPIRKNDEGIINAISTWSKNTVELAKLKKKSSWITKEN